MSEIVTIRREQIYMTPGTNRRAAWHWCYAVEADGQEYKGEGLGWARRLAKAKANGRPVVETWRTRRVEG